MPMHILLTKADKLTYGAAKNTLLKVQAEIRKGWGDAVTIQLFSAPKRMGLEEAYTVLAGWMELADKGAEQRPSKSRNCLGAPRQFSAGKKNPGLHMGREKFRGSSSEPLGRGPDICQHLTQHRSIEGLHQPFSNSEWRFTD